MRESPVHDQVHGIAVTHTIPAIVYYLCRGCIVGKLALGLM